MITRRALAILVSLPLLGGPVAGPALADGSAFVGGLLGGALGSAIVNSQQQRRYVVRQSAPRRSGTTVNAYQREENRRVQTALNYFGFNAGPADGVIGRNSRAAIGQYQAFLGNPSTGVLTDYERTFLTSSHERAQLGGPATAEQMSAYRQGTRGLLLAYRDEQRGVAPPGQSAVPVVIPEAPIVAAEPEPDASVPDLGEAAMAAAAPGGLPSFLPGPALASMASHCNRVNLTTGSSGGFVTVSSMSDPFQALDEQFCLARNYAIEQGDSLAVTVQGFSMAEMQEQCEAFAPSMREHQARLASQSPEDTAVALQDFVVSTGAPPAALSGNARICLGIGYRTDNAELALASAMVLVGLGEPAYGELIGHHLLNGFATPKRTDKGVEWLDVSVSALEAGAHPLVAGRGGDRTALLRAALAAATGAQPEPTLQDAAAEADAAQGFVLPRASD